MLHYERSRRLLVVSLLLNGSVQMFAKQVYSSCHSEASSAISAIYQRNLTFSKCILIHHKNHTVESYEHFDVLRLCVSWLNDRCHKDEEEEQWLCLALKQLAEELCKTAIERTDEQRKKRARDLEIMRSTLDEYGMLESSLTPTKECFIDQPEIPIAQMRLLFQQVLQLVSMDTRQIQLEHVKANYGETLLSEFIRSVNKLTVDDLKAIAENQVKRRLLGKGYPQMATPNWQASVIRCAEMLRPMDICITPDGTVVVADAEAGLLVFNSKKCLINKVDGLHVRSVCYHPVYLCIVAAVPNEQKAKFYDSGLILKREITVPHADPSLQIRCTDMGVLFCATYDAWTCSVHLHCCLDEKEWRTFAILPDSVQQFFGITLLPAIGRRCQNLAKLLLVTDTGNMYEIIVERLASTVLKHMRPIKIDQLDLVSSTSITTTDHESVVIVDGGIFYEITSNYKFVKTIGSVGSKAMVTSLAVANNVLYATICNRRCIALFSLE
ncbi:hypothetical protein M514_06345 [Trichuris suis]|uniref:Uncharacterized protein n=1 Tax=Trichuris suis TaxID=68888 RepID=A0A085MUC4_9BILA|nr:hypothetical protein M513_06345 [Trichuris suis]KFD60820.1 hypothetical protein M514_06345 [Trichuris suis]